MGVATILFNGAEPFEQIVSAFSTEKPRVNSGKIAQTVSEKKREQILHAVGLFI